ncbi:MAG: sigma 54-interacting transcriptional regulator [Thermoanaerobaculum sp.]
MVSQFLGESPQARRVREEAFLAAENDLPVLLLGETGTGKTFLAELIHRQSHRKDGPFVPVDVGGLPPNLVHTELFGCTQGAFTDAKPRQGLVRTAHGGTLFLDEVVSAPGEVQAALLQLLDKKTVRPVGCERWYEVDCRTIAASRQDLKARVREGLFREDLYFRLAGHTITLPPLRERGEDVLLLANHWLRSQTGGRVRLSAEACELMEAHSWPGNVRELVHRLSMAVGKAQREGGLITASHLGLPATGTWVPQGKTPDTSRLTTDLAKKVVEGYLSLAQAVEALETEAIRLAMVQAGTIRQAARMLGMSPSSLQSKLEKIPELKNAVAVAKSSVNAAVSL